MLIPALHANEPKPPQEMLEEVTAETETSQASSTASLRNHGEGIIAADDDFFAAPPAEIGDILSAHTTLRRHVQPTALAARIGLTVFVGLGGLAFGLFFAAMTNNTFFQLLWPAVFTIGGIALALSSTRFKHTCTYVGRDGLARFTCQGSRESVLAEIFLFQDAQELKAHQTRQYHNGVYQGTSYAFTWTDIGGRPRFVITGVFRHEAGNPPDKDPYYFGTAAEVAWTVYLANQMQAQLSLQGTIYFGLGGKNWLRIGERQLILHQNDATVEWSADELAEVRVEKGQIEIRRHDAREGWFSSSGIWKFPYANLANARLFLILMDRLLGVRVQ